MADKDDDTDDVTEIEDNDGNGVKEHRNDNDDSDGYEMDQQYETKGKSSCTSVRMFKCCVSA